jgi:hypothetical protein
MTPPKALLSPPNLIDRWLAETHPDDDSKSLRSILEELVSSQFSHHSTQKNFPLLGKFFGIEEAWWITEKLPHHLLKPIAAILADSWIYRKWLQERNPTLAEGFSTYFAQTVNHPEWIQAVSALAEIHYPANTPNSFEDLVCAGDLKAPASLQEGDWRYTETNLGSAIALRHLHGEAWLREVFEAPVNRKADLLESGLSHINLAAISGNTDFFKALGNALNHTFEEKKQELLEDVQRKPFKGKKPPTTNRPWCRRLWISRGLWLIPTHILEFEPFNLAKPTVSELTGKIVSSLGKRTTNDSLYVPEAPWLNEFIDLKNSISLTTEGKKMLPEFASSGLPLEFVSFDFKDTN